MRSTGQLIICNVYLSLLLHDRTPGKLVFSKQYLNENFSSFEAALEQFFRDAGDSSSRVPIAACIACAGPVCNNKVEMTNRDGWIITAENIKKVFGIKTVNLINDFAAVGYGLLTLQKEELVVLQDAPRQSGAPMATIGAGTGLGECYLTPGPGGDYVCYPCEGGHAEFAPRSEVCSRTSFRDSSFDICMYVFHVLGNSWKLTC